VKRVLITGMSGTGKSSVIAALAARGYRAIDADEDGLSELVSVPVDEPTGLDPGQDWVWREDRMRALLAEEDADLLFLGGCSPNQGTFYPQLDHVILLSAPADVIVERLTKRTNNPYGQRPEDVARTLALLETIEPLLRRGATHEIVTTIPVEEVVERVLRIVDEPAC
jgi:shikimate kinase